MNQGSKIYLARAAETIPNDKVMDAAALTALVAMPASNRGYPAFRSTRALRSVRLASSGS